MNNGYAGTNEVNALALQRNARNHLQQKHKRKYTNLLNSIEYQRTLDHIRLLFSARFSWDLSSLNVSNHYIEQKLFYSAFMCFYNDPIVGWIVLPATPVEFNVYNEPTRLLLSGYNYSKTIPYSRHSEDACLLFDNNIFIAPSIEFTRYASLISDVSRSCEVYANAMKKPIGIVTSFDNKKSSEAIIDNISINDSFILYDASIFPKDETGKPIITEIPSTHNSADLRGLDMYKTSLYDEMLNRLGIESSPIRKQAQQSEDEINKADSMARIVLSQSEECRQSAVLRMAEISDLHLTCETVLDIGDDSWQSDEPQVKADD